MAKPTTYVLEISSLDAERYYRVTAEQLKQIIEMTPTTAGNFINDNCELAKITCSDDADLSFADNMDQAFGNAPPEGWEQEWEEFKQEARDLLEVKIPPEKMRKIEYYRCWASSEGDRGDWDTDYIEIPASTPEDKLEEAIREAALKIEWKDKVSPAFVGLYCSGGPEETENESE